MRTTTGPTERKSERAYMAELVDVLGRFGWRSYHTFDSRHSVAGFPDIVAIKGSRLLAIEVKSDTGKVSAEQREWLVAFANVEGVDAFVIRPADDLSELLEIMR